MHVLYINLDSRHDRKQRMEAQCKKLGIFPQRISAVTKDTATLALDLRSRNNLSLGQKSSALDIDSLGAVACFQSHREAWKFILSQKWEQAWILEDDAIIRQARDIYVDEENPMVWLGQRGQPKSYSISAYPYPVLKYDRESYGSHGYCIHASILPELLENTAEINLAVDSFLNEFFYFRGTRVGILDIAYTNEFLSFSDIHHMPIGKPKLRRWLSVVIIILVLVCVMVQSV